MVNMTCAQAHRQHSTVSFQMRGRQIPMGSVINISCHMGLAKINKQPTASLGSCFASADWDAQRSVTWQGWAEGGVPASPRCRVGSRRQLLSGKEAKSECQNWNGIEDIRSTIISGAENLTRKQEQPHPISGWGLKGLSMNLPLSGL